MALNDPAAAFQCFDYAALWLMRSKVDARGMPRPRPKH
jgi:hypothetical protein